MIFNIKTIKGEPRQAFGVTLYYFSPEWKLAQLITAERAEFGKRGWTLHNGKVTLFTDNYQTPLIKEFEQKKVGMEKELSEIQTTSSASDFLSLGELHRYIRKNENAGIDMSSFLVDYHKKLAFPFSILVMALLGAPFSISHSRSGGGMQKMGIVMALTFFYWTLYSSGLAMGKHGYIGPKLAVWGPNVLIFMMTIYLFRARSRYL